MKTLEKSHTIRIEDIGGHVVSSSRIVSTSINDYLNPLMLERSVIHAHNSVTHPRGKTTIIIVVYGKATMELGSHVITLRPDDIILVKNNEDFTIINSTDEEFTFIMVHTKND